MGKVPTKGTITVRKKTIFRIGEFPGALVRVDNIASNGIELSYSLEEGEEHRIEFFVGRSAKNYEISGKLVTMFCKDIADNNKTAVISREYYE